MRPLTVKGCGEVVEWFCTQRNKNNAALTRANADGFIYVWTQTGKSNKRKVDGSEVSSLTFCIFFIIFTHFIKIAQVYLSRMSVFVDSPHKDTLFDLLTYFRDQWFKYGAYFSLWKLDKDAPRTNNACEIYHAHTQRYFTPGAYLGQWVHQFRVVQNAEQNYCMDLIRGKPVKHRFAAFYAGLADQLDQRKEELKSAILDESGEIFLRGQISRFLSSTGKILGIKPANVERVQNVSLESESERNSDDDIGSQTPIDIRDMSDLAELDSFLSS
ncbi:hypothetical protein DdX_20230 [Ditylenchus destructor]|uniref:Uncharacterized protein n=1 Tax=Ditylenchus destructor TaxID=166010 RepID=A0AAD4ML58_9BILA|nr:hypothetical protein DdX_20230 [Ditylenchus destructor]